MTDVGEARTPQEGALVEAEALVRIALTRARQLIHGSDKPIPAEAALDSLLAYIKQLEQQNSLGSAPGEGSPYASGIGEVRALLARRPPKWYETINGVLGDLEREQKRLRRIEIAAREVDAVVDADEGHGWIALKSLADALAPALATTSNRREASAEGNDAEAGAKARLREYEARIKQLEGERDALRDRLLAITEWKPRDGYMAVHIARAALQPPLARDPGWPGLPEEC